MSDAKYQCNKCNKIWLEDDIFEHQEALFINDVGGYGSVFGDGVFWSVVLCQICAHEILSPYIKKVVVDWQ